MKALAWDERVLDAVARAKETPVAQFEAVCKMAVLVFHTEKQTSKRRLTRTASACGWSQEQAEAAVLAMAKILMDAAKAELSKQQLMSSVRGMGLAAEHATVLALFYSDHREMIKLNAGREIQLSTPQYRSLDWRVDLEMANRMTRHEPTPIVTVGLNTIATPCDGDLPTPHTTCFRVDYTNLKKLQQRLETALQESDSVHVSRMQRYLH